MKYAIITPTHKPHFKYIKKYLESYEKYVVDSEQIELVFTISAAEGKVFSKITKKYAGKIPFRTLFIEDILAKYDIRTAPEKLLTKYKKFTFQTLKKYYTMLYVDADYSLVLDSETMWVRETRMVELFERYYKHPFITYSNMEKRRIVAPLCEHIVHNVNYIFRNTKKTALIESKSINETNDIIEPKLFNIWCLENFVWYYDKKILHDMFDELGSPMEMANYVRNIKNKKIADSGIFEINLYQTYIVAHNDKYQYKLIDADESLEQCLKASDRELFLNSFYTLYNGRCGLLERILPFLTFSNYKALGQFFKENQFNIIRGDLDRFREHELNLAEDFLSIVEPYILAASQHHLFGINATPRNRFIVLFHGNKYYLKIKKHWKMLATPIIIIFRPIKVPLIYIAKVLIWIIQPLAILLLVFRLMIYMLKKTSIIFKS